jgi:hypothetical protein
MFGRNGLRVFAMLALVGAGGCFNQPKIDVGSLKCATNDNCPSGHQCVGATTGALGSCVGLGVGAAALDAFASPQPDMGGEDSIVSQDAKTVADNADAAVAVDIKLVDAVDLANIVYEVGSSSEVGTGVLGTGGVSGSGGMTGSGGTVTTGGISGSGGVVGLGGIPATGGAHTGGSLGSGGTGSGGSATGGTTSSGGSVVVRELTASTSSLSLGDVVTGQTSSAGKFTVTYTGQQPSGVLTVASSNAAFVVSSGAAGDCTSGTTTLAVQASCSVRVVFTPSAAGTDSALITVAEPAGDSAKVTVSGNGVTPAHLSGSSTSINFSPASLGGSSLGSMTLTNTGQQGTGFISVSSRDGQFVIQTGASGDCSGQSLSQNANCTIRILFKPTASGQASSYVDYSSLPGGSGTIQVVGTCLYPDAGTSVGRDAVAQDVALAYD